MRWFVYNSATVPTFWLLSLKMYGSSDCIANSISSSPPPYTFILAPYTWMFLCQRHPPHSHISLISFTYALFTLLSAPQPSFLHLSPSHIHRSLSLSLSSIYSTLTVNLAAPVCSVGAWKQIPWRTCSGISSAMITPDPFHAELGKQSKPHFVCHIFQRGKRKQAVKVVFASFEM